MSFRTFLLSRLLPLVLSAGVGVACSGDENGRDDESPGERPGVPTTSTEENEDGEIIEKIDTTGDGNADIRRYFEEYTHPRDETVVRRRLRKMEIDVNNDGQINVRRHYDEFGNVAREENDVDLNGKMDSILYYAGGELARKELIDEDTEQVEERRVYLDGELVRVEQDRDGSGEIDRWEYYEDGVLVRIGRDTVGDGSVDTWQLR